MAYTHNLIIYSPVITPKVYSDLVEVYKQKSDCDLTVVQSSDEANELIKKTGHGVVIFALQNKPELVEVVKICKANIRSIKKDLVKISGFNLTNSDKVDNILRKHGCADILDEYLTFKTLDHKVSLWTKSIGVVIDKIRSARESAEKVVKDTSNQTVKAKDDNPYELTEPLKFASDCWVIGKKTDIRFVMGHWIVELVGPGPYVGRWDEVQSKDDPDNQYWQWVPMHEETYLFIEHEGRWVFRGKKPEFQNDANKWQFVAPAPALFFTFDDGSQEPLYRFKIDNNGKLDIARNSKYGQGKKEMMLESADPKVVMVHEEEQEAEDKKIKKDDAGDLGGTMEAKSDGTEHIETRTMESKTAGTEHIENRTMDGKTTTEKIDAGPMVGKIGEGIGKDGKKAPAFAAASEDAESEDVAIDINQGVPERAQEIEARKKSANIGQLADDKEEDVGLSGKSSTDNLGGHLSGKSSTDNIDDGPMVGKVGEQAEKAKKKGPVFAAIAPEEEEGILTGKQGQAEQIDGSPMSGKGGTDNINGDPLKGKVGEATHPDGSPMSGKGGTDNLNGDPLKGKIGQQAAEAKKKGPVFASMEPEADSGPLTGKLGKATNPDGSPMSGKGGTDSINGDPLKGKVGEATHPDGSPMSGKGGTDNLNRDPLKGKIGEAAQLSRTPMSGKGGTDNINGDPLKGKIGQPSEEAKKKGPVFGIAKPEVGSDSLAGKTGEAVKLDSSQLAGKAATESEKEVDDLLDDLEDDMTEVAPEKKRSEVIGKFSTKKRETKKKQVKEWGADTIETEGGELEVSQEQAVEGEFVDPAIDKNAPLIPKRQDDNKADMNLAADIQAELAATVLDDDDDDIDWDESFVEIDNLDISSIELSVKMSLFGSDNAGHDVTLDDIIDNILVVRIPSGQYGEAQEVIYLVDCSYSGKDLSFEMMGNIIEILDFDDGEDEVICNVELTTFEQGNLDKLQEIISERQKNILDFFKAAKGQ